MYKAGDYFCVKVGDVYNPLTLGFYRVLQDFRVEDAAPSLRGADEKMSHLIHAGYIEKIEMDVWHFLGKENEP